MAEEKKIVNKTLNFKIVFLLICIFYTISATIQARPQKNNTRTNSESQAGCATQITKEEMELLLKDANPLMLKRLTDDAELRNQQIKNLKELLATACQAVKEGFADNNNNSQELNNIEIEIIAVNYDREINKGKGSMPPFSFISEDRVKEFYANADNEIEFENFLKIKIELAKDNGQIENNSQPTKEDIEQAKNYFAKTRIYYTEAQQKANTLSKEFWGKANISVKLQKAQFLSRIYSKKVLEKKSEVTDEEVQSYIAKHPEFDTRIQKAKAYKILRRAEAGENFARLADEFSEDPGNLDPSTKKKHGGLYTNITKGQFVVEFEQAALSLKPGQIYPSLVETTYGYHIIKLIQKGEKKGADGKMELIFDVRHILISTGIKDPNNSVGGLVPVKEFVKNKLKEEKEKQILDEILKNNPITIAEDFEIPKVTDEQIQQQMQQQMRQQNQRSNLCNNKEADLSLANGIHPYKNGKFEAYQANLRNDD
ncbi:hypothetical protein BH10ACI1_BH10ACI1_28110 [soil metagenome]